MRNRSILVLAAALVLPGPVLAQQSGPTIRGNPRAAFGPDFYPVEAMRNGEEGRVVALISVGQDGIPTACTIIESSGSPSLDATTCKQSMTLGFDPAQGSAGEAVAGSYRLPVRWALPKEPPGTQTRLVKIVTSLTRTPVCSLEWAGAPRSMSADACAYLAREYTKAEVDLSKPVYAPVNDKDLIP